MLRRGKYLGMNDDDNYDEDNSGEDEEDAEDGTYGGDADNGRR